MSAAVKGRDLRNLSIIVAAMFVMAVVMVLFGGRLTGQVALDTSQTYRLTQSVVLDYGLYAFDVGVGVPAVEISADDVVLDCAGATIAGSGAGIGIVNYGHSNVTLKDCFVQGFEFGLNSSGETDYSSSSFVANVVENIYSESVEPGVIETPGRVISTAQVEVPEGLNVDLVVDSAADTVQNIEGMIKFSEDVPMSGISSCVILGDNLVGIKDTSECVVFDRPAELQLRGLGFRNIPVVLRDGAYCPEPDCIMTGYDGSTLSFNVSGFSNYSAGSNSQLFIYDDNDGLSTQRGVNTLINFTANYSKLSDSTPINTTEFGVNCTIVFNTSATRGPGPYNMSYITARKLYVFNTSFNSSASVEWNVSCKANSTYESLNGTDFIDVFPHCGDNVKTSYTMVDDLRNATNGTVCTTLFGLNFSRAVPGSFFDCAGFSMRGNNVNNRIGVYINNSDFVFKNCNLANFTYNYTYANATIGIRGSRNISIINTTIFIIPAYYRGSIYIERSDDVLIENCSFYNLSSDGHGINVLRSKNLRVFNNYFYSRSSAFGASGRGIVGRYGSDFHIAGNTFSTNYDAINFYQCDNSTVYSNFFNAAGASISGSKNISVFNNFATGITFEDVQMVNIINNSASKIEVNTFSSSSGSFLVLIANNTVTGSSGAIDVDADGTNITIFNNFVNATYGAGISCASGGASYVMTNISILNNTVVCSGSSCAASNAVGIHLSGCGDAFIDGNLLNISRPFALYGVASSDFRVNITEMNRDLFGRKILYITGGNVSISEDDASGQVIIGAASNVTIKNSVFRNISDVLVRFADDVNFSDSNITARHFMYMGNIYNSSFSNLSVSLYPSSTTSDDGVTVSGNNLSFVMNRFYCGGKNTCVYFQSVKYGWFIDNDIVTSAGSSNGRGLYLFTVSNFSAGDNRINVSGSSAWGADCYTCKDVDFFGNLINSTADYGFYLEYGANNVKVRDNVISSSSDIPLYISGGSNNVNISNNTINVAATSGIYMVGGDNFNFSANMINVSGTAAGMTFYTSGTNLRNVSVVGNFINVSRGAGISCTRDYYYLRNISILNNLIFGNSSAAGISWGACENTLFDNNIINVSNVPLMVGSKSSMPGRDLNVTRDNFDSLGNRIIFYSYAENVSVSEPDGGELLLFGVKNFTLFDSLFENASNVIVFNASGLVINNSNFSSRLSGLSSSAYPHFVYLNNVSDLMIQDSRMMSNGSSGSTNVYLNAVSGTSHIIGSVFSASNLTNGSLQACVAGDLLIDDSVFTTSSISGVYIYYSAIYVTNCSPVSRFSLNNSFVNVFGRAYFGIIDSCMPNFRVENSFFNSSGNSYYGVSKRVIDIARCGRPTNVVLDNVVFNGSSEMRIQGNSNNFSNLFMDSSGFLISPDSNSSYFENINMLNGSIYSYTNTKNNSFNRMFIGVGGSYVFRMEGSFINISGLDIDSSRYAYFSSILEVYSLRNSTVSDVRISNLRNSSSRGVRVMSGARDSVFKNISVSGSLGTGLLMVYGLNVNFTGVFVNISDGVGVWLYDTNNSYLRDSAFFISRGPVINASEASKYTLATFTNVNFSSTNVVVGDSLYHLIFENVTFDGDSASVFFPGFNISGRSDVGMEKQFNISVFNRVFLNSSNLTFMNTSATLTFKGIDTSSGVPGVLYSESGDLNDPGALEVCVPPLCSVAVLGSEPGTVVVNVSGFSLYALDIQEVPTHGTPILNSSDGSNSSYSDIVIFNVSTSDINGDRVKNIFNWFRNGTSIIVLNMPFESNNSGGVGKTKDYSPYINNGTLYNGVLWNATGGFDGRGAYQFDGVDDYIDLGSPYSFPNGSSARSVCAWGKSDSVGGAGWMFAYGSPVIGDAMFIGRYGDALYGGGFGDDVTYPGFWSVGVWKHVCLTYDGAVASLYGDGVLLNASVKAWSLSSGAAYVGMQVAYGEYWDGTVDEVAIYNRSLSAEQVRALYENRSNTIVSSGLRRGDVWSGCITPNDGFGDGLTKCSSNMDIVSPPAGVLNITLISPNGSANASQFAFFNFTVKVKCEGGDCGNVAVTLDPLMPSSVAKIVSAVASGAGLSDGFSDSSEAEQPLVETQSSAADMLSGSSVFDGIFSPSDAPYLGAYLLPLFDSPSLDYHAVINSSFPFNATVFCVGGACGDVSASLNYSAGSAGSDLFFTELIESANSSMSYDLNNDYYEPFFKPDGTPVLGMYYDGLNDWTLFYVPDGVSGWRKIDTFAAGQGYPDDYAVSGDGEVIMMNDSYFLFRLNSSGDWDLLDRPVNESEGCGLASGASGNILCIFPNSTLERYYYSVWNGSNWSVSQLMPDSGNAYSLRTSMKYGVPYTNSGNYFSVWNSDLAAFGTLFDGSAVGTVYYAYYNSTFDPVMITGSVGEGIYRFYYYDGSNFVNSNPPWGTSWNSGIFMGGDNIVAVYTELRVGESGSVGVSAGSNLFYSWNTTSHVWVAIPDPSGSDPDIELIGAGDYVIAFWPYPYTNFSVWNGTEWSANSYIDPVLHSGFVDYQGYWDYGLFYMMSDDGNLTAFSGPREGSLVFSPVPIGSGSTFFTEVNPLTSAQVPCLASMSAGSACNVSWNVTVNGTVGGRSDLLVFSNSSGGLFNISQVSSFTFVSALSVDLSDPATYFTVIRNSSDNFRVLDDVSLSGGLFSVPDDGVPGVFIFDTDGVSLDCGGAVFRGSGAGLGFNITSKNDIVISGCGIDGYSTGMFVDPSYNVTVEDTSIFGAEYDFVIDDGASWVLFDNVTVGPNVKVDVGSWLNSTGVTFSGGASQIRYSSLNLSGVDTKGNLTLVFNNIYVDSADLPQFDQSAEIKLFYINMTAPHLYKDGVRCDNTPLCNVSYDGQNLTANVSGFSNYSAQESWKGIVPYGSGTPFYTITSNPMAAADMSCLEDMLLGEECNITWSVDATGALGSTWEFFVFANSTLINNTNSSKVNITIVTGGALPPSGPNISISINESSVGSGLGSVRIDWNVSDGDLQFKEANVSYPNGTLLQTSTDPSVDFVFLPYDLPSLGAYSIKVFANNTLGGSSYGSGFFSVVDLTLPAVQLLSPVGGSFMNVSTFNVSCSATNLQLKNLSLYHNASGSFVFNQSVNVSGAYNVTNFTLDIVQESYFVWNCLAFDVSGNGAFALSNYSVEVDAARPDVKMSFNDSALELGVESISIDWNASDANLQFREANVSYPNGTLLQRLTDVATDFVFLPSDLSASGTYSVKAFAYDLAGNVNLTSVSFVVSDTVVPVVSLLSPLNSSFVNSSTVSVSCGVSDVGLRNLSLYHNLSSLFILDQSVNISGAYNVTVFTLSVVPDAYFVWNCLGYDLSGNAAFSENNFSLGVDTVLPVVGLYVNVSEAAQTVDSVRVDWNVSDANLRFKEANVSYPNGTLLQTLTDPLTDFVLQPSDLSVGGVYYVRVFANDSAGNGVFALSSFEVIPVGTPVVTLNSPPDNDSSTNALRSFRCSASVANTDLVNISLFADFSGSFVRINSTNISGSSAEAVFTVSDLPASSFVWNCLAFSMMNGSRFAHSNRTFMRLATPSAGGGGGGGGGGGKPIEEVVFVNDGGFEEVGFDVRSNQVVTFSYSGVDYEYRVSLVNPVFVMLKSLLTSESRMLLFMGPVYFDFDEDGYSDAVVVYAGFDSGSAALTARFIEHVERPFVSMPISKRRGVPSPLPEIGEEVVVPPLAILPEEVAPVVEVPEAVAPVGPVTFWTVGGFSLLFLLLIAVVVMYLYRGHLLQRDASPVVVSKEMLPRVGLSRGGSPEMLPPVALPSKTLSSKVSPSVIIPKDVLVREVEEAKSEAAALDSVLGGIFAKQERLAKLLEKPKSVSDAKLRVLEDFVSKVLRDGFAVSRVRHILLERGWPADAVEHVLFKVKSSLGSKSKKDIVMIRREIELADGERVAGNLIDRGLTKEQVREGFIRKGWKPKDIDRILKNIP